MTLPVALQLYSVRDDLAKDFAGVLHQVKAMGYDGVELSDLNGMEAKEVKALLEKEGLTALSAHVPPVELFENLEKTVAYYKEVGCRYLAFPWMPEEMRETPEVFMETVAKIAKAGAYVNEQGMTLLYHNHDFEFKTFDGKYLLDILYDTVPEQYLKTEIDTCWVKFAGLDPADYVRKYTGRAPVVHLKDFITSGKSDVVPYELLGKEEVEEKKNNDFRFCPLGCGVQELPTVLSAVIDAGAEWVVVEQDFSEDRPPLEAVKMSREYLRSIGW